MTSVEILPYAEMTVRTKYQAIIDLIRSGIDTSIELQEITQWTPVHVNNTVSAMRKKKILTTDGMKLVGNHRKYRYKVLRDLQENDGNGQRGFKRGRYKPRANAPAKAGVAFKHTGIAMYMDQMCRPLPTNFSDTLSDQE